MGKPLGIEFGPITPDNIEQVGRSGAKKGEAESKMKTQLL
jgi:hypothetical protein